MLDNSTPIAQEISQHFAFAACRTLRAPERVAALAAGLRCASIAESDAVARELIGFLGREAGDCRFFARTAARLRRLAGVPGGPELRRAVATALAMRWSDLGPGVRSEAIGRGRTAMVGAIVGGQGRDGKAKISLARLIGDLGDPGLAHLVPGLLIDGEAGPAAEETLVILAGAVSGAAAGELLDSEWGWAMPSSGDMPPAPTAEARREMHARVGALAGAFTQHRRQGVLKAAIVLLDPGTVAMTGSAPRDPLVRWFRDSGHESHMALRAALKRSPGALVRQRAWEWLGRGVAESACADRLMQKAVMAEHTAVLERSHLRLNPARARRLGQMRTNQGGGMDRSGRMMLPGARQMREMPVNVRRGLPGMAANLPLGREASEEVYKALAQDVDPCVRFGAFLERRGFDSAMLHDVDERVARVAALRLVREIVAGGVESEQALEMVRGSPHRSVRAIGCSLKAAIDPWNAVDERSRMTARRMLAEDRGGFVRELRMRIDRGEAGVRTGAIMLARRLSLVGEVELELLRLAAATPRMPAEERLSATAVAALGGLRSGAARAAVRACVHHEVGRVRANAVEAMLRPANVAESGLRGDVIELKQDPDHRVRANVLRAVLLSPRGEAPAAWAAADLTFMLADSRPLHRLAGLWVLERVMMGGARRVEIRRRWNELASRLADLTREEPEAPVRARAARCARLMLGQMRMWDQESAVGAQGAEGTGTPGGMAHDQEAAA